MTFEGSPVIKSDSKDLILRIRGKIFSSGFLKSESKRPRKGFT